MRRALSTIALLAAAAAADAQVVETDHLRSQLVADATAVVPGTPLRVGLLLEHAPHWHTYWKNPGDSGLPTKIELDVPAGFAPGTIEWPAPQRFVLADIVNYGYDGRVVLPVTLAVPASFDADEVTIRAHARWLVCEHECIPGRASYALTLPVRKQAQPDPRTRDDFAAADARRPQSAAGHGTMRIDAGDIVVDVDMGDDAPALADAATFPATPQVFANGALPAWTRTPEGWQARWPQSEYFTVLPAHAELVLVVDGRAHAVNIQAATESASAPAKE